MSDNANTRRIYLIKVYTSLLLFAIKRSRPAGKDITDLLHLCLWPLLYFLDFKGETRTPIGILMVGNRDVLRSFVYGFLKTEFAYKKNLTRILPEKNQSSVIVDVGANIGDFSLAMKERAKRIIAIEPGEENFVALTANLRRNYARNVFPVKVAASNSGMDVV